MQDISPELLEKLQAEFKKKFNLNKNIKKLNGLILSKKATFTEANEFAFELGNILAETFQENLSSEILPDGRMYFNIAKKVIEPQIYQNYELISAYSSDVQNMLNKKSGMGIKAIRPPVNQDRIDGIIKRVSDEEEFDKIKWILNEPIKNFSQSVVDDTIKANAEFQYKAGLKPKIVRKEFGKCCEWCREVVGVYEYPKVPKDVYKRHRYCRCSVEYIEAGKRQNVWTKKWKDIDEDDKIKERIEFSQKEKINKKFPKDIAKVKRGNMMSFEEANGNKPNPKFNEDRIYRINCQTCVVAFEARCRGYDVQAKGNFKGSLSEMLSRATNKAWIDPKTKKHPEYIKPDYFSNINTPVKYVKYLEETLKDNTRYTMQFGWKGRNNSGHIVNIFKDKEGLKIYDPQTGKLNKDVKKYLKDVKFTTTYQGQKFTTAPKLLEVQNYEFNLDVVNEILEKSGD